MDLFKRFKQREEYKAKRQKYFKMKKEFEREKSAITKRLFWEFAREIIPKEKWINFLGAVEVTKDANIRFEKEWHLIWKKVNKEGTNLLKKSKNYNDSLLAEIHYEFPVT